MAQRYQSEPPEEVDQLGAYWLIDAGCFPPFHVGTDKFVLHQDTPKVTETLIAFSVQKPSCGKGKRWVSMCSALLGCGSLLEQIFGTSEAVHSAMHGQHAIFSLVFCDFLYDGIFFAQF